MKELVLHETGQLAELGNVAPEKIHPMHHAQDAPDIAFAGQNRF